MEKFGIFELLDTLSALISPEEKRAAPAEPPHTADKAFAPPAYGEPVPPPPAGAGALASFLDKHDRTVKSIGGSADAKPPKP